MKSALLFLTFWCFTAFRTTAADLSCTIAIATTESTTIMGELVSERFWKSFGAAVPFDTEEKQVASESADGTRSEHKYRGIRAGTTGTLTMGPAKLHLKLTSSSPGGYEFLLSTEGWDAGKMRFPDPAGSKLKVTVDGEAAFTLLIIECSGLPAGVPAAGTQGMSQMLTIFSSNLKTMVETGKPMFDMSKRPRRPAP